MLNNDIQQITDVINNYFQGTYHGNADLLSQAFHPNARITGIIEDNIIDWSISEFITRVTEEPTADKKGEKYNKKIILIDVTKCAAIVKTHVEVGYLTFIDYITLLKIHEKWVIRNKSFMNISFENVG
jgi:hypothetical protein